MEQGVVALPRLLLSAGDHPRRQVPEGAGVLMRDLTLTDLVRVSADASFPLAVDADTVQGLAQDQTAIAFLAERLRVAIVITRRPVLASRAADLGCLSLLHVHCLDSTGLERAMASHPGAPVGTAVSPGLILAHLGRDERESLPRPLLAYGLVRRQTEREEALAAGADSVVVASDLRL